MLDDINGVDDMKHSREVTRRYGRCQVHETQLWTMERLQIGMNSKRVIRSWVKLSEIERESLSVLEMTLTSSHDVHHDRHDSMYGTQLWVTLEATV